MTPTTAALIAAARNGSIAICATSRCQPCAELDAHPVLWCAPCLAVALADRLDALHRAAVEFVAWCDVADGPEPCECGGAQCSSCAFRPLLDADAIARRAGEIERGDGGGR